MKPASPAAADLDALAIKLESSGPPLTASDRRLLRSAIASLAMSEMTTERLERLLHIHQRAEERADLAAAEALSTVGSAIKPGERDPEYDFAGARDARRRLVREIEKARSASEITRAVLAFARDAAIVLG